MQHNTTILQHNNDNTTTQCNCHPNHNIFVPPEKKQKYFWKYLFLIKIRYKYHTNHNWLTMEMNGLFTVGALFPEFSNAKTVRIGTNHKQISGNRSTNCGGTKFGSVPSIIFLPKVSFSIVQYTYRKSLRVQLRSVEGFLKTVRAKHFFLVQQK